MSRRRPKWGDAEVAMCAAELAAEVTRARRARAWEIASGGRFIPSDEDRALFDRLLGPMAPVIGREATE